MSDLVQTLYFIFYILVFLSFLTKYMLGKSAKTVWGSGRFIWLANQSYRTLKSKFQIDSRENEKDKILRIRCKSFVPVLLAEIAICGLIRLST